MRSNVKFLIVASPVASHGPANWPLLRDALKQMGRSDLIGNGPNALVPATSKGKADTVRTTHKRSFGQRGKKQARRRAK